MSLAPQKLKHPWSQLTPLSSWSLQYYIQAMYDCTRGCNPAANGLAIHRVHLPFKKEKPLVMCLHLMEPQGWLIWLTFINPDHIANSRQHFFFFFFASAPRWNVLNFDPCVLCNQPVAIDFREREATNTSSKYRQKGILLLITATSDANSEMRLVSVCLTV